MQQTTSPQTAPQPPAMSRLRKAAIVLAALDAAAADVLIDQMPPEQARQLRDEIARLEPVPAEEQQAILREFLRERSGDAARAAAGVEVIWTTAAPQRDADIPHSSSDEESRASGHSAAPPGEAAAPFAFLARAERDDWIPSLAGEHPQTIAVVAAHLPPARAAAVLARLPMPLQADVLQRVARLEQTDPAVLHELEAALVKRLSAAPPAPARESGLARALAILQSAPSLQQQDLLAGLAQRDPDLAHRLRPRGADDDPLPFTELERVPLEILLEACAAAEPEMLILALAGCDPQWVLGVLRQLPAREARLIKRSLDRLGPARLSEIEQARQQLLELAARYVKQRSTSRLALTA